MICTDLMESQVDNIWFIGSYVNISLPCYCMPKLVILLALPLILLIFTELLWCSLKHFLQATKFKKVDIQQKITTTQAKSPFIHTHTHTDMCVCVYLFIFLLMM